MIKNRITVLFLFVATALFTQLSAQESDVYEAKGWGAKIGTQKLTQTQQELLDSIVYLETYDGIIYNGNKETWEYRSDGLIDHYSWYIWRSDLGAWWGIQRLDSTFDAHGRLSVILSDNWDSQTSQWNPGEKSELSYDADGNQILYANYVWNADNQKWEWDSKSESTHTYTEDSLHIIYSINYTYDKSTGVWTPHHRNELNYDKNGKRTLYNASFLDTVSNTWVFRANSFKYEMEYDEQGRILLHSYYVWNNELNQWKGQGTLTQSSYDAIGNTTVQVLKKWDVSLNQWANSSKTENTYNEQGNVTRIIDSEWDTDQSLWVVVSQREYFYNAYGKVSKYQVLLLDTVSNEWYPGKKDEYTYDINHQETLEEHYELNEDSLFVLQEKLEIVYNTNGKVMLTTFYELDEDSGALIKQYDIKNTYNESGDKLIENAMTYYGFGSSYVLKYTYYYSLHTISSIETAKGIETASPLVYPSPFTDQLTIQLTNTDQPFVFELFDVQGQKVVSKRVQHSEKLNVANLPAGVYIYILSSDNKMYKGKVIKN